MEESKSPSEPPSPSEQRSPPAKKIEYDRRRRWSFAIDLAVLLALFAIVCGPFLRRAFESAVPGGWDGVPHYAIADIYARELFPALGGWMDEYFAGMPYPNFYPPVFYMAVAALTKVGLSTRTAFWTVQTVASAAVPCLTYLCARKLAAIGAARRDAEKEAKGAPESGRIAGLVAGAVTVGFMVDHNPLYRMGITLHSTVDAGLSTQLLSHVFLLVFYRALLSAEERRGAAALAAAAFALVPLSNVHMVWAAGFVYLPLSITRVVAARSSAERRRRLLVYGAIGLAGVLLSACWTIPMITNLGFVPTQALEAPPPGVITFAFLRLGFYLVFGGVAAAARRDGRALSLVVSLLVLLGFAVLPSPRIPVLRDLAIQPTRVLVPFPFLSVFLVGYLVSAAGDVLRRPWAQPLVGAVCVAFFFARFKLDQVPKGNLTDEQMEAYENALGPLAGRTDGRVLVEMGMDGMADPFALQALAGMRGARSLTTVFRESSIDVMFAVPLRNSFSSTPESFGIDHKISGAEMATDPVQRKLARLQIFNVRYFAIRSDKAKAQVAELPGVHRLSPPGLWELWGFDAEAPGDAVVPKYAPVLTFAKLSVKPRPDDGVDFVRLGEEMFASGRLEVPLVLAREGRLDRSDDWDRFQAAVITEYRYDHIDAAFDAIERASRDRPIVLWPSNDPLYTRLVDLGKTRETLRFVAASETSPTTPLERRAAGRAACLRILDALDAVKVPLMGAPSVVTARLDGRDAVVELDRAPDERVPIWVRQGYFPSWKNDSGEPVYMATPTFQLTFTRERATKLRFRWGGADWVARLLALVGVGIVVGLWRRA